MSKAPSLPGAEPGGTPARHDVEYATSRPRVLGWIRSAAILDGDWGTSIAYVLGIGFALGGYASFWHLLMMLALTSLVAVNYMTICRLYPTGGGVYSSVHPRSPRLAVVGALLLGADYVITMALSVFDGCHYLGIEHPAAAAMVILLVIGGLNWYGPKHAAGLALLISFGTVIAIAVIIAASAGHALTTPHLVSLPPGFLANWNIFVGIILSISGIEAISNMTGLMRNPRRDSRKAILAVLAKVVIATVFLGLAMCAVPGLTDHTEDMVRFLGEHYVGPWFGWVVAATMGMLLLSAGNTALNGLISIQFRMAVDRELPRSLRRVNKYGVPVVPLLVGTAAPIIVLAFEREIMTLAQLYAIGVVGAILINVASTATNPKHSISRATRIFMGMSAAVLFCIEVSIAIAKPKASIYAAIVLTLGMIAREMARREQRSHAAGPRLAPGAPVTIPLPMSGAPPVGPGSEIQEHAAAGLANRYLVAIRDRNDRLLHFAAEEAQARGAMLMVLRVLPYAVSELPARLELDANGHDQWIDAICRAMGVPYQRVVIPSTDIGFTIVEQAAMFGVDRVILGASRRGVLESTLRGSLIRTVTRLLPEEIQLVIFGG